MILRFPIPFAGIGFLPVIHGTLVILIILLRRLITIRVIGVPVAFAIVAGRPVAIPIPIILVPVVSTIITVIPFSPTVVIAIAIPIVALAIIVVIVVAVVTISVIPGVAARMGHRSIVVMVAMVWAIVIFHPGTIGALEGMIGIPKHNLRTIEPYPNTIVGRPPGGVVIPIIGRRIIVVKRIVQRYDDRPA